MAALLTVAVSWLVAGKPAASSPIPVIGGFEGWARIIGGVLEHAGVLDPRTGRLAFLDNVDEMYEQADESTGQWEGFLQALLEPYRDQSFTTKELAKRLRTDTALRDALPDELEDDLKPEGLSRRLGIAFSKRAGRRYGESNLHLERAGKEKGAVKWRVLTR